MVGTQPPHAQKTMEENRSGDKPENERALDGNAALRRSARHGANANRNDAATGNPAGKNERNQSDANRAQNRSAPYADSYGERRKADESPEYRARVFDIVRRIPAGRVMNYGQIADILGEGYTARTVGFVMHAAEPDVPWQRVINAQGGCSTTSIVLPFNKQQALLEAEGVVFNEKGKCDLNAYRWTPPEAEEVSRRDIEQGSLFD